MNSASTGGQGKACGGSWRWPAAIAFVLLLAPAAPVQAGELVMYERQGCPWCAAWEQDIGRIYDRTEEARRLRLRRVDIEHPEPADAAAAAGVRFTPTFVIADCGREAARIIGFTGDWQFWGLLDEAIRHLPAATPGAC